MIQHTQKHKDNVTFLRNAKILIGTWLCDEERSAVYINTWPLYRTRTYWYEMTRSTMQRRRNCKGLWR